MGICESEMEKLSGKEACTMEGIRNTVAGRRFLGEMMNNVKEIKITYKDGREKVITRGVCFSVYEDEKELHVSCDGVSGGEGDVVAVLAIISQIATEMGIDEDLVNKVEKGEAV